MQTRADLKATQISINQAQQFLQRLKGQEEAAKRNNQIAMERVQEEIKTLVGELQDPATSGGDRAKRKEIQIALAAARADAGSLEQVGKGLEERERAAGSASAGVENLDQVERKLAQSVEGLDVATSTNASAHAERNPAGRANADLSDFAGREEGIRRPATGVGEEFRADDPLRIAAARDTSPQPTAESLSPEPTDSSVECISAEPAGDDVTVTEELALWEACLQAGDGSEQALAEERLRSLEVSADPTIGP
ncbi:MAG: hypothetical protein LJE91_17135 [Gammaproteobacteria bacterium]|jgi:hypothetical protein|nr:hypothetical protein [Gammaproteobacteria bacterium]